MNKEQLNPLGLSLLSFLQAKPQGYSVHALIAALEVATPFPVLDDDTQLHLFKKNFLVMNALFELQEWLFTQGLSLQISTLSIVLGPQLQDAGQTIASGSQAALKAYYLDWDNYSQASVEEVDQLLNYFWSGYRSADRKLEALSLLGLEEPVSPAQVQKQYRRLIAEAHPDRGGDPQRFIAIRSAWEVLKNAH